MIEKDQKNQVESNEGVTGIEENEQPININADSDVPGTSYMDESLNTPSEVDKLNTEITELKDKYIRLVAEFDNFRKRNAKEKLEIMQTAGKDVIIPLLDVLDDFERAQKQMEVSNEVGALREGVTLVFNKLKSTLQNKGVKPMKSIEEEFNPDLHEAITEIPAPNEKLQGKVLDEVQKGYYLNDKIIRFAKVVVGK